MAPSWWATHSPHWNRTGVIIGAVGVVVAVVAIVVSIVVTNSDNGSQPAPLRTAPAPRPTCPGGKAPKPSRGGIVYVDGSQRTPDICWTPILAPVKPGQQLQYLIAYNNVSRKTQQDVEFGAKLAPGVALVPNTTRFYADSTPSGGQLLSTNVVTTNGILLGSYASGAGSFITFDVVMPLAGALKCGINDLRTVVTVQPKNVNDFYSIIETEVNRDC